MAKKEKDKPGTRRMPSTLFGTTTKRQSRRKENPIYKRLKTETYKFKWIFARNLVITAVSIIVAIGIILWIAPTVFTELWEYTYDNIDVNAIDYSDFPEATITIDISAGFGVSLIEQFIKQLTIALLLIGLSDALWLGVWVMRVARFVYLVLMITTIIYLLAYWLVSQILHLRLRFTTVFFSCFLSSAVSFLLVFFAIPNNETLIQQLGITMKEFFESNEPLSQIPVSITLIISSFYQSFLVIIVIHLFTTSTIQYLLRDF